MTLMGTGGTVGEEETVQKEEGGLCCQLGLFMLDKSMAKGQINRAHRDSIQPEPQHLQTKIVSWNSVKWEGKKVCVQLVYVNCCT